MPNICIVSGGDQIRYQSYLNHKVYALESDCDYRLEAGPLPAVPNKYFFKVKAVLDILPRYDWIVWIDDDAFITDFSRTSFFADLAADADRNDEFFVVADGPTMTDGAWTRINSGVFLVKNTERSFTLLEAVLASDLKQIEQDWDGQAYGKFSGGDQDAFVYWLHQSGQLGTGAKIISHRIMNARPWHYNEAVTDGFIVHFPGMKSKRRAMYDFTKRWGLSSAFLPPFVTDKYNVRSAVRRNYPKLVVGQLKYQLQKRKLANER